LSQRATHQPKPSAKAVKRSDFMKKNLDELEDDLRPEYDFSKMVGGVRGKYVDRYQSGTNMVLLDPDIAKAFPTDVSVNDALRLLLQIAQRQQSIISEGV
jgi:hypothetical protein